MRKEEYIQEVISKIENKKARREVEKELSAHIDDRISYYVDAGWDEEQANQKAMEHMGEPEKVSQDLKMIHQRSSVLSCGIVLVIIVLLIVVVPRILLGLYIQIPVFKAISPFFKQELVVENAFIEQITEYRTDVDSIVSLSDYEEGRAKLNNYFVDLSASKREEMIKADNYVPVTVIAIVSNDTDQYLVGVNITDIESIQYNGENIQFYQEKHHIDRVVGDIGSVYQYELDRHSKTGAHIDVLISKDDYVKMFNDADNIFIKLKAEGTKSSYGDGRADAE